MENDRSARRVRVRRAALLGSLYATQLLAGCYRAVPIADAGSAANARRVIASLTMQGTTDLAAQVGPGVVRLEGDVAGMRGDTLELALTRTEQANGTDNSWQRQRVLVPRASVATLAERRLDRKRSWLAAAAVGAMAFLAAVIAGSGGGGGGGDGQPVITPPG
ncbi:MAG: hypothetical protein V4617_05395 [Gemmatimonadota bacterium]